MMVGNYNCGGNFLVTIIKYNLKGKININKYVGMITTMNMWDRRTC